MDRERAETFLRLLAEAELRDPLPPLRHAGGATDFPFFSVPAPVRRAAWALTAVQALDVETADSIKWPTAGMPWSAWTEASLSPSHNTRTSSTPPPRTSGHRLLHDHGQFRPNSTQNCPRS